MKLFKSVGSFFALDIGTNAVRVVQLDTVGNNVWSLAHYGYMNIDEKLSASDSEESKQRLGEAILTVVGQSGISTRNVVLGLPSQKTFTTVVEVPITNDSELASLMKYQVYNALESTLDAFVSELTKSVKFFQTRYPGISVSRILMSGYGMSIPKLSDYVSTKSGLATIQANPWQKVQVSQADQQKILPVASEFATVVGLAQRDTSI